MSGPSAQRSQRNTVSEEFIDMPTTPYIAPTGGQGIYGAVPGQTPFPQPYEDLSAIYPNLGATNAAMSRNIIAGLAGFLPLEDVNQNHDDSAAFGVSSGMPGSGLVYHREARDLNLKRLDMMKWATQAYNQTIPTISQTQTLSPALQVETNQMNAINASAYDPTAAGQHAEYLYNKNLARSSASGVGGYTRMGNPWEGQMTPSVPSARSNPTEIVAGYMGPDYSGPYYGYMGGGGTPAWQMGSSSVLPGNAALDGWTGASPDDWKTAYYGDDLAVSTGSYDVYNDPYLWGDGASYDLEADYGPGGFDAAFPEAWDNSGSGMESDGWWNTTGDWTDSSMWN
jgi:hypothetical protein